MILKNIFSSHKENSGKYLLKVQWHKIFYSGLLFEATRPYRHTVQYISGKDFIVLNILVICNSRYIHYYTINLISLKSNLSFLKEHRMGQISIMMKFSLYFIFWWFSINKIILCILFHLYAHFKKWYGATALYPLFATTPEGPWN